jgi:hypothetical protein
MADNDGTFGKVIFGVVVVGILSYYFGGSNTQNSHRDNSPVPVPPKKFCPIPRINGSIEQIEVSPEIPCDQIVEQAMREIEAAKRMQQTAPDIATDESSSPSAAPNPPVQVSPNTMKKFNEDLTNTDE